MIELIGFMIGSVIGIFLYTLFDKFAYCIVCKKADKEYKQFLTDLETPGTEEYNKLQERIEISRQLIMHSWKALGRYPLP